MRCRVCDSTMREVVSLSGRLDDECLDYSECIRCGYIEYFDESFDEIQKYVERLRNGRRNKANRY